VEDSSSLAFFEKTKPRPVDLEKEKSVPSRLLELD